MRLARLAGAGWIALLGGGDFSFGETVEADGAWLARTPPGTVGFLPAASGSSDYGLHFARYLGATFGRQVETIPIFRPRDARRERNVDRIRAAAGVYLGGGLADQLLDALLGSPALGALEERLAEGATLAATAAAAQACGAVARGLGGGAPRAGLGWLPGGVVEANFDPAHDRRLRRLLARPEARWGLGIPAGAAVLLGPGGEAVVEGVAFALEEADGELAPLGGASSAAGAATDGRND